MELSDILSNIPQETLPDFAAAIVETMREPLLVLRDDLRINTGNRAFYEHFQVTPQETEDVYIYDLGNGQWNSPALRQLLEDLLPTNGVFEDFEIEHEFPHLGRRIMLLNARRLHRHSEQAELILLTITDVTELRQREREIQRLNERLQRSMTESFHRLKNNLQVLAALTAVQIEQQQQGQVPVTALQRIQLQISLIAALHDLLTQEAKGEAQVESVSLPAAMKRLLPLLQQAVGNKPIHADIAEVSLPIKACASLSLLISEATSNAIKHGAQAVTVTLAQTSEMSSAPRLRLEVCDDGPGFAADFDAVTSANTGLEVMSAIGKTDLQGEMSFFNQEQGGACVAVVFPLPAVS